jgi:hypothetical protein
MEVFIMGETKSKQVSFRVRDELSAHIQDAAVREDLKTADLVRKIFSWAFDKYQEAGSLHALRARKSVRAMRRRGNFKRA